MLGDYSLINFLAVSISNPTPVNLTLTSSVQFELWSQLFFFYHIGETSKNPGFNLNGCMLHEMQVINPNPVKMH